MKNLILSCLLATAFAAQAAAGAPVEAWLSGSSFDGDTFKYQYTAYDTSGPIDENVEVACEFSKFSGRETLSAINVRIFLNADFDSPGQEIQKSGQIDLRSEIEACRKLLPTGAREDKTPVRIKLPPLSVPSIK
jgi:hypothetical protein